MTITIGRAQLSSALNGFYCEAPDGVDPEEDNALRTCGRIALMTDGVLKDDGVVGTIVLRYNFVLTDPKVSPEGSALAGAFHFTESWTGTLDPLTNDCVTEGKPPVTRVADGFLKRSIGPVLLIAKVSKGGGDPALVLKVDGVTTAARSDHDIDGAWHLYLWHLPVGRQRLEFSSANTLLGAYVDAFATGAVFPAW
jgi:hypothetical protein